MTQITQKKKLIVAIAKAPGQAVPYADALDVVDWHGIQQMIRVQVLKKVGENLALDVNGEELAAKYLAELEA